MPKKSSQHGGRREGAGRKVASPEGPSRPVGASVPAGLLVRLDELAAARGWTRSQAVAEAIRRFVR